MLFSYKHCVITAKQNCSETSAWVLHTENLPGDIERGNVTLLCRQLQVKLGEDTDLARVLKLKEQ